MSEVSKSLGSGARALGEYACDAMQNWGNHACECGTANERCAQRRQLASKSRARARVELRVIGP
eukprot:4710534-Pleurochrysis_carterae.AAC.1